MSAPRPSFGLRHVLWISLAVALATSAPYVALSLETPRDRVYLGMKAVNSADFLTYAAWMAQDTPTPWLRNLYTSDPAAGRILVPFFWLLGLVARDTGLSSILVLHLARATSCFLLYPALFWFCGLFLPGGSRVRGFLLLGLGTGLPGFVPEASPISACYDSALFVISWTLLVLGMGLGYLGLGKGRRSAALAAGAIASVLAVIHPYDAVTLLSVLGLGALLPVFPTSLSSRIARLSLVVAAAIPGCCITAFGILETPGLARWAASPRPLHLLGLLSFGCLWIGAGYAVARCRHRCPPFLVLWLATSAVLILVPSPIARRLLEGMQAPLAILATIGFEALMERGWGRFARLTEVTFYPAAVLMLLIEVGPVPVLRRPSLSTVPRAFAGDLKALGDLPDGAVFGDLGTSYLVPAFSGKPVYCGHYDMTPDYRTKQYHWKSFEEGRWGIRELGRANVRYVVAPRSMDLHDRGLEHVRDLTMLSVFSVPSVH